MSHSRKPSFHQILQKERKKQGWSQQYIAEKLGIDTNTVSRWERGLNVPYPIYRSKLSELFGITPEEFGLASEGSEITPVVFLSYAQADVLIANRIREDLKHRGIAVWSNEDGKPNTSEVLQPALQNVQALILLASLDASSANSVSDELEIAETCKCPVYALWIAGERRKDALPPEQTAVRPIDVIDARGESYGAAMDKLAAALSIPSSIAGRRTGTLGMLEPLVEPRNPYKGLHAFDYDEKSDFFGRDQLINGLANELENILAQEDKARLLAVIGPSGSGKSSLVKAGLLPRLQLDELSGSSQWIYLRPIVPGKEPLKALTYALKDSLKDKKLTEIGETLADKNTGGLHLLAEQLVLGRSEETKVVLVVDQLEELFTLTTDEQKRKQFIDLLTTASTEPGGPVLVILTLRADFYDKPMCYIELGMIIEQQNKFVFPMSRKELQAAIEKPAQLPDVQLTFDEGLVSDLVFEVYGQSGALPLLQFTLDQLFRERKGHRLTRQAYNKLGGVKGALAKHADSTYTLLPSDEHRRLARALFLRLIDPGDIGQDATRRRITFAELTLNTTQETMIIQQVATEFLRACLLTTNADKGSHSTIEISHEALIGQWDQLAAWLTTYQSDVLLRKEISEVATRWIQRGKPVDLLYRGMQLAEAHTWAKRNVPSRDEIDFLSAADAYQQQQVALEQNRQARELTLQRQATRRQRYVIGLMALTSVVLITALAFTLFQQALLQNTNQQLRRSLPASVTNNHDSGPGSLREAIANASPNSTITFEKDLQGPIRLTHEIDITQSLIISGLGVKALSISGQGKHRIFRVLKGAFVTILNLMLTDGFASNCPVGCDTRGISSNLIISDDDEHAGGAILNGFNSTLTLINVTVSTSTAGYGAIFNNGTLTLLGSHISANKTSGLFNSNQGTLTLNGSIVSGNVGATYGGGINSWGGTSILTSTISGNTATYGGGLYTAGNPLTVTLVNSTISNNTATTSGGGICSPKNGPNLVYTTVYENRAAAIGGGIAENAGEGCGNYASDPGQSYAIDLKGSIIAGDSAPTDPDIAGNVFLDYPNLIQHLSSGTHVMPCGQNPSQMCTLGKKSLFNVSPRLGPLQDNGGPTPTHALLVGSPALNQIPADPSDPYGICGNPSSLLYPVLNDQRGESRPYGKGCDLGAYEAQQ